MTTSISERIAFFSGRIEGLAHTARYPVDLGMQAELEEIAKELMRLSKENNADVTSSA